MVKKCAICGANYEAIGSCKFCSPECARESRLASKRRYMANRRQKRSSGKKSSVAAYAAGCEPRVVVTFNRGKVIERRGMGPGGNTKTRVGR